MRQHTCNLEYVPSDAPGNSYNHGYWILGVLKIFDYPNQGSAMTINSQGVKSYWKWSVDKDLDLVYRSESGQDMFVFTPPVELKNLLRAKGFGPSNRTVPVRNNNSSPQEIFSDTPFRF